MTANKRIILVNEEDNKKVGISTRGDVDALLTEIIDASGNQVTNFGSSFEIPNYDYIALTYVTAEEGNGEIETIIYKTGGASGSTVATLTLAYNSSDEISSITKT